MKKAPGRKRAEPRRRPRKSAGILDAFGPDIVAGRIATGEKLPSEAVLCAKFAVSRPSLREALKALAGKGLIDARQRRGTIVLPRAQWDLLDPDVLRWIGAARPDADFLSALLEVRMIIEPAAARLAAQRADAAQIDGIEQAYRDMEGALPSDVEACCVHDLTFHERIISAAGNVVLTRLAAAIRVALLAAFRISANARQSYESSLSEHWALAAAIRNRAADEAEHAARLLLAGTARDLAPALDRRSGALKPRRAPPRDVRAIVASST